MTQATGLMIRCPARQDDGCNGRASARSRCGDWPSVWPGWTSRTPGSSSLAADRGEVVTTTLTDQPVPRADQPQLAAPTWRRTGSQTWTICEMCRLVHTAFRVIAPLALTCGAAVTRPVLGRAWGEEAVSHRRLPTSDGRGEVDHSASWPTGGLLPQVRTSAPGRSALTCVNIPSRSSAGRAWVQASQVAGESCGGAAMAPNSRRVLGSS